MGAFLARHGSLAESGLNNLLEGERQNILNRYFALLLGNYTNIFLVSNDFEKIFLQYCNIPFKHIVHSKCADAESQVLFRVESRYQS